MFLHSEELTTTKAMPFRTNPLDRWGLPTISSLRAVLDAKTSTSVSRLDLAGKTHRRWSRFGWYRSLVLPADISVASTALGRAKGVWRYHPDCQASCLSTP